MRHSLPTTRPGPPRAALYARVSTAEQKKGWSLDAQVRDGTTYCRELRKYQVVRVFREQGSRRDMSREKLVRLLELADRRAYDVLVVWRRDRFGAGHDVHEVEAFLKERGVRVEAVLMGPQPDTSITKFVNTMMDAVADLEVNTIQERFHAGRLEAARQGKWPTKPPPGWTRTYPTKDIIVDEAVAPRIRAMFELVADGCTLREVAKRTDAGDHVNVLHRIHSTAFKGKAYYAGILVPFPPIVSPELWDRAQVAVAQRKRNHTDKGQQGA
ncbi:MAG: recombinase family protein [Thermoplasmatota archaeon]